MEFLRIIRYGCILMILISASMLIGLLAGRANMRRKQLVLMREFEQQQNLVLSAEDHRYTGGGRSDYFAADGEVMAILRLDRLGIKVSVAEGVEKDVLKLSAGHFPESELPGQGNFAIAGHSSRVYTCLFNKLHDAVKGDLIVVTTRSEKHEYLVTELFIAKPEDLALIEPTNESVITIVTCTNNGAERLIIRCVEI